MPVCLFISLIKLTSLLSIFEYPLKKLSSKIFQSLLFTNLVITLFILLDFNAENPKIF